jgi:hypothetical protein
MKKYIMYTVLTIMSILLAPALLIGELWYIKNYVTMEVLKGAIVGLGCVFFIIMLFALPMTIAKLVGGFFAGRALRAKTLRDLQEIEKVSRILK